MLKGGNIVCFSSTEWIGRNKTSKRYLMEIFSKTNKVLFVETIGSRTPGFNRMHFSMIFNRLSKWFKGPFRPDDISSDQNLWVYSPIVIPLHHLKIVRLLNQKILIFTLKRILKKLNMPNPILWFYLPTASVVIGNLNEKKIVYHLVDDWSTYPGFRGGDLQMLDDKLMRHSNYVFVSNKLLLEKKKYLNSNIYHVPHGVNYSDYNLQDSVHRATPEDVKLIKKPVIAMIGAVSNWIDWKSLIYIAKKHPDWSILMIGPIGYDADLSSVRDIPNIYLLGPKKYQELPDYYSMIDVCVVSFLLTEHIKYCFPTRFYEHLANGKPVVSTDFPVAREFPADLVKISKSPEEFESLVAQSLKETGAEWIERRKLLAKSNTWVDRAELMSQIIEKGL